jgi:hypothetical protein
VHDESREFGEQPAVVLVGRAIDRDKDRWIARFIGAARDVVGLHVHDEVRDVLQDGDLEFAEGLFDPNLDRQRGLQVLLRPRNKQAAVAVLSRSDGLPLPGRRSRFRISSGESRTAGI